MPAPKQYVGRPDVQRLPSGLLRITRYLKVTGDGVKAANIGTTLPAYGTADAEYTDAFLIEQSVQRIAPQATDQTIVLVFQQLADATLTSTNDTNESTTFDGRRVKRLSYLCKVGQADSLKGAVGDVDTDGKIFQIDVQKGPVVAIVTRFYIENTAAGFVLSDQTDYQNNGKLTIRTIRTVASAAATPAGFTATGTAQSNQDGYTVYTTSFAKGDGVIDKQNRALGNGVREITWTSLGSRTDPAGTIVAASEREADGYKVYAVTSLQTSDGGSIVGTDGAAKLAHQYQQLVEFPLPGTVDIEDYVVTPGVSGGPNGEGIKLVQTPPTPIKVLADVFVFFQEGNEIVAGDKTYDGATGLWNPNEWATLSAVYTPVNGAGIQVSEGYRGYRTANGNKTLTASVAVSGLAWTYPVVLGNICSGNLDYAPTHRVTLSGGPNDPVGERYVLDVDVQPVFVKEDGTQIYRKTIVVATIATA